MLISLTKRTSNAENHTLPIISFPKFIGFLLLIVIKKIRSHQKTYINSVFYKDLVAAGEARTTTSLGMVKPVHAG